MTDTTPTPETEIEKLSDELKLILDKAIDVLGSTEKALDWIDHISGTLGATPRKLAETAEGTVKVLLHLATISRHSFT